MSEVGAHPAPRFLQNSAVAPRPGPHPSVLVACYATVHVGASPPQGAGRQGRGQKGRRGVGLPWPPAPHSQMLTCPFLPTTPPDTTYLGCPGSPAPYLAGHRKSARSALPGETRPFRGQGGGTS
jgi:hypothetical protein